MNSLCARMTIMPKARVPDTIIPYTCNDFDDRFCEVRDVRYLVAMRGKADVADIAFSVAAKVIRGGRC